MPPKEPKMPNTIQKTSSSSKSRAYKGVVPGPEVSKTVTIFNAEVKEEKTREFLSQFILGKRYKFIASLKNYFFEGD